jgi:dethiobiotin synthetase
VTGLFVTGTDTGVGKSVLAAAIVAGLTARGVDTRALKPVMTGIEAPPEEGWPPDHVLLASVSGCEPEEVVTQGYGPAVSPHLAAELEDRPIEPAAVVRAVATAASEHEVVIVEGVGGLLVPLNAGYDVRRLAAEIGMPMLVAARPGLGTINHTLLTLESAREAGLHVTGVVLTPWPREPDEIAYSNWETIEQLGAVEVSALPRVERPDPALLAAAGGQLPLDRWLEPLVSLTG